MNVFIRHFPQMTKSHFLVPIELGGQELQHNLSTLSGTSLVTPDHLTQWQVVQFNDSKDIISRMGFNFLINFVSRMGSRNAKSLIWKKIILALNYTLLVMIFELLNLEIIFQSISVSFWMISDFSIFCNINIFVR